MDVIKQNIMTKTKERNSEMNSQFIRSLVFCDRKEKANVKTQWKHGKKWMNMKID